MNRVIAPAIVLTPEERYRRQVDINLGKHRDACADFKQLEHTLIEQAARGEFPVDDLRELQQGYNRLAYASMQLSRECQGNLEGKRFMPAEVEALRKWDEVIADFIGLINKFRKQVSRR